MFTAMRQTLATGGLIILLTWLLICAGCSPPQAGTGPKAGSGVALPDIPQVSTEKFLPAVRQEVQKAYEAVRAQPNDAQANGRLGMVLHAHGQFEAAATCYRRAMGLDAASFSLGYYFTLTQAQLARNQ